jgi:hypothetical protein
MNWQPKTDAPTVWEAYSDDGRRSYTAEQSQDSWHVERYDHVTRERCAGPPCVDMAGVRRMVDAWEAQR